MRDSIEAYNYLNPTINPASAKVENYNSILQTEGFLKRFKGTMGSGIDWDQYEKGRVSVIKFFCYKALKGREMLT